jgi:lipopolysaccharide export LptBFGC system permease protein LptF
VLGAGNLAFHEFLQEGTCPKLEFLPACYLIFGCLVIPFISHIINKGKVIYYLFTGIALTIATYATIGQLLNFVQCPKTESGIPMCYISFIIFASLVLLKLVLSKMNR